MNKSNWETYWEKEKNQIYWHKPAAEIARLIEEYSVNQYTKVLDLGCGIGRHAIAFARAGYDVTAVDSSGQALAELSQEANKQNLCIETITGSYLEPIFAEESFDIIICYNVIYHGCRHHMERAINLCKTYLRHKGILFFTCPSRNDGKYGSGEQVAPHTYKSLNSVHPGDIHYFSNENDIHDFTAGLKLISLNKDEHYWDNNCTKQFSSYWQVLARRQRDGSSAS